VIDAKLRRSHSDDSGAFLSIQNKTTRIPPSHSAVSPPIEKEKQPKLGETLRRSARNFP